MQVLSCGLGGEWSGKAPTCKYIDCGAPPNTDNGRYELLNRTTTYGSLVEYSCREDYWLDGTERQMCTREGKWSADTPACICKLSAKCLNLSYRTQNIQLNPSVVLLVPLFHYIVPFLVSSYLISSVTAKL